MSMLTHRALYHVAIVVNDLDAAKQEYTNALGLSRGVEGDYPDVTLDDSRGRHVVRIRFAYSSEAPVRLELLQAVPDTILVPSGRGQLHHLGYWSQDVERDCGDLVAQGMTRLASLASVVEEGRTAAAYVSAANGGIIELVDEPTARPLLFPDQQSGESPSPPMVGA